MLIEPLIPSGAFVSGGRRGNSDGPDDFSTIGDSNTTNIFADWGPSGDSLLYLEYVQGTDETLEEVRLRVADLFGSSGPVDLLQEADSAPVGIGTVQWRP